MATNDPKAIAGDITIQEGNVMMYDGTKNIVLGHSAGPVNFTTFKTKSVEWLQWDNETETIQIFLNGQQYSLEPEHIIRKHPLDVGAGTDYEKEHKDLAVIREKYEAMVKIEPTLAELRRDYDDLLQKYRIMDALKGDENAES